MPLDLATARAELDDARATLATLQEQVRNGDDTVTAQQLADQRELIEYAALRVTAAQRAEQQAAADDLDARATAVGDAVRDLVAEDSTAPLVTAVQAVISAVQGLAAAADERETRIRKVASAGESMNAELGWSPRNPWPSRQYGFLAQTTPPVNVVAVDTGRAVATPLGELLGAAVASALVGRSGALSTAAQLMSGVPEGVARVSAGVPGLADALRLTAEQWQALDERARSQATQQGRTPASAEVAA